MHLQKTNSEENGNTNKKLRHLIHPGHVLPLIVTTAEGLWKRANEAHMVQGYDEVGLDADQITE